MDAIIENAQKCINKLTFNEYISYESSIYSILKPIIIELNNSKKFPKINDIGIGLDAYVEALMLILYHEYSTELPKNIFTYTISKDTILPTYCIVYVLMKHPIFLSVINSNLTNDEWKQYKNKLLESITDNFGDINTNNDVNLLKTRLKSSESSNLSAIHQFRYFIGFSFKEESTSIKYDRLPTEESLLFVNISYNINNLDSIILYNTIPSIRRKLLLNVDKIDELFPFSYPDAVKAKEPYQFIKKSNDKTMVILNYNTNENIKKSSFTVAYFNGTNDGSINTDFVDKFIAGATPLILKPKDIESYMKQQIFKHFNEQKETDLILVYNNLMKIASDSYDDSIEITIKNVLSKIKNIINDEELPVFTTYLHGLNTLIYYDKPTVIRYICNYISEESPS